MACPAGVALYPGGLVLARSGDCSTTALWALRLDGEETAGLRRLVRDAALRSEMDRWPSEDTVEFGEGPMWIVQAVNDLGEPVEVVIADYGMIRDDLPPSLVALVDAMVDIGQRVIEDGQPWPVADAPVIRIAPAPEGG